jgi:superfamily II DNA or RNA helicase
MGLKHLTSRDYMRLEELQQDMFNVVNEKPIPELRHYQKKLITDVRRSIAAGHKRIIKKN